MPLHSGAHRIIILLFGLVVAPVEANNARVQVPLRPLPSSFNGFPVGAFWSGTVSPNRHAKSQKQPREAHMNPTRITQGKITLRLLLTTCIGAAALMLSVAVAPHHIRAAGSDHVRWDIVDFVSFAPPTFTA